MMKIAGLLSKSFVVALFWEIATATSCQRPDLPEGGYYQPIKDKYWPGDKVEYHCFVGYLRSGKDVRTCQPGGKWTDKTPFCDWPVKLKNPMASSVSVDIHRVIDKNWTTCFSTKAGTNQNIRVSLDKPAVITGIRMFLPKGLVGLEVSTVRRDWKSACSKISTQLDERQWVMAHCNNSHISESIHIQDISGTTRFLEICELEVFVKDTLWCSDPPDFFIPNGWLKVSREKVTLQCAEGYRPGDNMRLVCDSSSKWSGGILQCEEILCDRPVSNVTSGDWQYVGKESKLSVGSFKKFKCEHGFIQVGSPDTIKCLPNGTWTSSSATCQEKTVSNYYGHKYKVIIIAVSVVVSIVILTCFVIVIVLLLKRRSKPVVVVLKQGEDLNNCVGYNETQYSSITYDTMPTIPQFTEYPTLPTTRPPPPTGTSKQMEQHYPPPYNTTPNFEETFQETDVSSSKDFFETIKKSPLYGSS